MRLVRRPEMIDYFNDSVLGTVETGPLTAAPSWTLDDSNQVWVFFGTGDAILETPTKWITAFQQLYGMKDKVVNGTCTQATSTNCWTNDLINAIDAVVCIVCSGASRTKLTDPTNPGVTTFNGTGTTSMIGLVASQKMGGVMVISGPFVNCRRRDHDELFS